MKKLMKYANDVNASLVSGYKSPQSIAKAYKQYLMDKSIITSKVISAIAAAVERQDDSIQTRSFQTDVLDIIEQAGLRPGTPVFTPTGDVTRVDEFISSILNDNEDLEGQFQGLFGHTNSVADTIDSIVDSYQVSKIAESAFATLEVTADTAKSSLADVSARINALGLELTSNASVMMANIGDLMSDSTTGIISKISSMSSLLNFQSEVVDDSDDSGIVLPDFSTDDMNGVSPMVSVLHSINVDIDFSKPVSAVVSAVKGAANLFKGLFNRGKDLVQKGWEIAKTYVDETFVDPVDFVILDEKSQSGMVDIPFFDFTDDVSNVIVHLTEMGISSDVKTKISEMVVGMPIGSMKSVYTPFSVINIVKENTDRIRVIGHLIPSRPWGIDKTTQNNDYYGRIFGASVLYEQGNLAVSKQASSSTSGRDLEYQYNNFIREDTSNSFEHIGNDDRYYLAAVTISLFRNANLMVNSTINMLYDSSENYLDYSPSELNGQAYHGQGYIPLTLAKAMGVNIVPTGGSQLGPNSNWSPLPYGVVSSGNDNWLNSMITNLIQLDIGTVTNKTFVTVLESYKVQNDIWKQRFMARALTMASQNDFNIMEHYYNFQGDVPAFLPSLMENEYQTPMYGIVSDSQHGEKIIKLFKGIVIVAAIVIVGVVAVKVSKNIKLGMKARGLTLEGRRRDLMGMSPDDPNYSLAMKSYFKDQRKFDMKNRFLKTVGLGANSTATSMMNAGMEMPIFNSNKDIIDIII